MTPAQLAAHLGLPAEQVQTCLAEAEAGYRRFAIPRRRGGRRWIEAPRAPLREVQRALLREVLYRAHPHAAAHGFVPARSILTHAQLHVGQAWVLCMDLEDFFPSVLADQVGRVLTEDLALDPAAAALVAVLTTFEGRLPQGAPTSPHLANLAFHAGDLALAALAEDAGLTYSRYADDLTLSGPALPPDLERQVEAAVQAAGFQLNRRKTRRMPRWRQQRVTGLVVNERVALPRSTRRWLRAARHRLRQREADPGAAPEPSLGPEQLRGYDALESMLRLPPATLPEDDPRTDP